MSEDRKLIGDIPRVKGPVLVIGGGPSALEQLEELKRIRFDPAAVLSANEHGFRQDIYPITYAVCCDPTHGITRTRMEQLLGQYDRPIISQCHFAHYRLPSWTVGANTGLTAILVGAMIGGVPVVPVGFDFYRLNTDPANPPDHTYFHTADAELQRDSHGDVSNSNRKVRRNFDQQITRIKAALRGYRAVRPLGGELLEHYDRFDPDERVARGPFGPMLDYTMGRKTLILDTGKERSVRPVLSTGSVEFNRRIPVDEDEAVRLVNSYPGCRVVAPEDHPLVGYKRGMSRPPDLLPPPPDKWPGLR